MQVGVGDSQAKSVELGIDFDIDQRRVKTWAFRISDSHSQEAKAQNCRMGTVENWSVKRANAGNCTLSMSTVTLENCFAKSERLDHVMFVTLNHVRTVCLRTF